VYTSDNVPEELAERPQWVCWRFEERDGKRTKVPYSPITHRRASTTDLMSWGTFPQAVDACEPARCDGVGFVFSSADPFTGIDLDNCRDPKSGNIAPWAREILGRVRGGYAEVSPSGRGIHIITRGSVRNGGRRRGPIEMYSRDRFFTVTGQVLADV
jgi:putative DNA primase/helicase